MAIVVEDGSQVADSNSYSTRADFIAYALTLGIEITDDTTADDMLIKAAIFIDTKESSLKGVRVNRDQSMAYPRSYLYIDNFYWAITEIPTQVVKLQYNLALDLNAGIDLYNPPQSTSVGVKRKKVDGAVEVEYATSDQSYFTRRSATNALLNSLMQSSGFSIPITMG